MMKTPDHYIVAIGASAGGLEAIHEFFDNMPTSGHLSFVIIQHLSPDYKSLLVELISKHTHMQVHEAGHMMEVQPGSVYVIPNNKLLTIKGGKLQLEPKAIEKAPNTAIDTFLQSLASDQESKAIAIILSGTGTDGSKGIMHIHNNDGLVMVQDPVTAKFDGMPNSAIATGVADYILAPELMPEEIYNYINEKPQRIKVDGRPDESALPEVLKLIEKHCQLDFNNYKTPTIIRRITRRMGILGFHRFPDYLELLRKSPEECGFLSKEFLIGVTKFFRDKTAFDLLHQQVLLPLIESKESGEVLKVWVTACSTGEEAYSIAMIIDDLLEQSDKTLDVKIFASDIDGDAIETAARGSYSAEAVKEINPKYLQKYFSEEGSKYNIVPGLRKQIVFARHNILKDPPFIKNDLVTCRNMLIYMNSILQRKVIATLQFSLNLHGYLFLGPSESPLTPTDGFQEVDGKWKLYRKIVNENRYNPDRLPAAISPRSPRELPPNTITRENAVLKDLNEEFKAVLTEKYGFAALYVDRNFEIKEAIGQFKKYLSLPDRLVTLNLLKMVEGELSTNLNVAIRRCLKENMEVALTHVKPRPDSETALDIFVRPSSKQGLVMLTIGESSAGHFEKSIITIPEAARPGSLNYVAELEEELRDTRAHLQVTVESLETANEELQSSNEELLSANEELQSSNEELQSLNEELHTLNTEHQLRIRELVELNDDLNNYFRSSEIAQVFVDSDFRIRRFNPVAVKMINLIESDIGRPIVHISTNIRENKNFIDDIQRVVRTEQPVEREVQLINGTACLMKIYPYLRQDKKTDGAVITFVDITNQKELNSIIRSVFNATLSAIMAFKAIRNEQGELVDLEWVASNYAADELLKKSNDQYLHQQVSSHFPQLLKRGFLEKYNRVVGEGEKFHTETQLEMHGQLDWFDIIATPLPGGLVISLTNINDKKKAEEKLKRNYNELIKSKESYRNLSEQLESKVRERTAELTQSEERFRLITNAISDAVWDRDLVQQTVWWSDSFYNWFGYPKTADTNTHDFWQQLVHPDDRKRVSAAINQAINQGSEWTVHYRIKAADGHYIDVQEKGMVLKDEYGVPFRLLGSITDRSSEEIARQNALLKASNDELEELVAQRTSDLKAQNEEFSFVTNFMPQMVWVTLPNGDHVFYNKGWYEYTGLSYEETKGEGWNNVLHPDDRERARKIWRHSLETGENYQIEYRFRRYDGVYRWFLGRAQAMRNEQGEIVKWFGTCTDIHDQKGINEILEQRVKDRTEELLHTNEELEKSNTELLQFASVASHDLKEPLRKIHLFSNMLKERLNAHTEDATVSSHLNRIIGASSRMTRLINDLLSFTRLSVPSAFEKQSLNQIVSEVLSDLEILIQEKHATFEIDDLPEVEVVSGHMRQVFQNIISNALKFSREGVAPQVRIHCERVNALSFIDSHDPKGDFVRITIADNGIGFDNQYADKIFTIFQRLHSKEKYDGTGIGLAITRKIIDKHNGIITAKSKPGEGANFIFVLPLKQPEHGHPAPVLPLTKKELASHKTTS